MPLRWIMLSTVLLLQGCGDIFNNNTAPTNTTTVYLFNYFFYPATDTIAANEGDTVTVLFGWTNGTDEHQVGWDDGPMPLPPASEAQNIGTYQVVLTPGTYHYECTRHATAYNMYGTIVVMPHPSS